MRYILTVILSLFWLAATAETTATRDDKAAETIEALEQPLYSPFTERYLLDEVKNLRQQLADTRVELTEKNCHQGNRSRQ